MAPDTVDRSTLVAALLAEFEALKTEIRTRSHDQSAAISLNLTAIAAIGSLYLSASADPRILFIVPIISSLLGMRFVDHAINIDSIGRFIQRELKPQLASVLEVDKLVDYEVFAESFADRSGLRFFLFGLPIGLLFAGVPAVALAIPFLVVNRERYDAPFWFGALLAFSFLVLFLLFWVYVVRRAKRAQPQ